MYCPICQNSSSQVIGEAKDSLVSQKTFPLDKCSYCGFLRTGQLPPLEKLGLYYKSEEYISHSNTKAHLSDYIYHFARRIMLSKKRRLVQKAAQIPKGEKARLLDIGCATGYFAHHMAKKGFSVVGVEQDKEARTFALEEHSIDTYENFTKLPSEIAPFDIITLWHVLEHIPNLEEHFSLFYERLNELGLLVLALPNPASYDACHYGSQWAAYDVPRHLWHFREEDIKELGNRYGFELIKVRPLWLDAYYISLLTEQQKGHSRIIALIKAFGLGLLCSLKTCFSHKQASSLIYFFQKE